MEKNHGEMFITDTGGKEGEAKTNYQRFISVFYLYISMIHKKDYSDWL